MASRLLDVTLKLASTHPINGLLTLDDTVTAALTYDDTGVTTNTASIATGSETVIIAASDASINYVYIKNTDTTNIVVVKTDAPVAHMDLGPGEFTFFPLKGSVGVEVIATVAPCIIDYITFKKA